MSSLEGQQIDRYRIRHLLGSGGMGDVYLAEDPRIEQQVAIKVIRSEFGSSADTAAAEEATRLFQREAKAIVKLDHPHILPLFDYGEQRLGNITIMYLVMPYRSEGSLADWLSRRGQAGFLLPEEVAHFISQAASALQHAHDRQVIHQDVKLANFLLRNRQETPASPDLLLTDFGIARITAATASASQSIRGTPTAMAPEQWEGHPVPATDQYALAVMAYQLLCGRPPFIGGPGPLMYQHLQTPPPPVCQWNPHLGPELDAILTQALAKQPTQRFTSILLFANALQQAIQNQAIASTFIGTETTLPSSRTPTTNVNGSEQLSTYISTKNKNKAVKADPSVVQERSLPTKRRSETPMYGPRLLRVQRDGEELGSNNTNKARQDLQSVLSAKIQQEKQTYRDKNGIIHRDLRSSQRKDDSIYQTKNTENPQSLGYQKKQQPKRRLSLGAILGWTLFAAFLLSITGAAYVWPYTPHYPLNDQVRDNSQLVAFALDGALLLTAPLILVWRRIAVFKKRGITIEGHVINHQIQKSGNNTTYSISYTYQINGETYSRKSPVSEKQYQTWDIGTNVKITYLPENPQISKLTDGEVPFCSLVGCAAIAWIFSIAYIAAFVQALLASSK